MIQHVHWRAEPRARSALFVARPGEHAWVLVQVQVVLIGCTSRVLMFGFQVLAQGAVWAAGAGAKTFIWLIVFVSY